MKIFKTALLMALLFYAGISLAEELPEQFPDQFPGGEEGFYEGTEDDVIISATRYIKSIEEAPASATVITSEQIRNMGARDLLDVLKTVPGIGISRITGYGLFGIESRGIKNENSQKVLIMIDGHRINEPNFGSATWVFNNLMVENIKRVEVIRGPGSALYGANAFVAVINVVTKSAKDIDGIELLSGWGSYDTQHHNILFGKEFSKLKIAGTFDYFDTNGPSLHVDSDSIGRSGHTDAWEEKYDLGLKMSYGDFSFFGRYIDRDRGPYIGILNALNDDTEIEVSHLLGELNYKRDIGENLHLLAKGYFDNFTYYSDWEVFPEGAVPGFPDGFVGIPEAKDRTLGSELQLDYSLWDKNIITVGALFEYKEQYDTEHNANFNPLTGAPLGMLQDVTLWGNWNKNEDRSVTAFYIQDVWKFTPNIEGTFGLRYDYYSDIGETYNPRAALVWKFIENARLKLLYGSAFRAPSFVELYNSNNPAEVGNPDLKPEKIDTYEVSIGYEFADHYSTNITYFHSVIEDNIQLDAATTYTNAGKVKTDGVEVEFKANFKESHYGYMNYTYQYPRDDETGSKLIDVAAHKGNIGYNYEINRYLNVNSNLLVVGPSRRASADIRDKLTGYEVLDLTLIGKNFFRTAEFRASVHNLLDDDYADPEPTGAVMDDYPRKGINFMIDFSYKW